jgi:pimeloyl-ACP methyl ester carboxylesterase
VGVVIDADTLSRHLAHSLIISFIHSFIPGEPLLAHEIIRGALVRYSSPESRDSRPPPTAVLVHGIMGSRRNMVSFAKRLVDGFPTWQVVVIDLRCHGDSAAIAPQLANRDHGVDSAAGDVLRLLQALKMFPEILIGHSFGGKVGI